MDAEATPNWRRLPIPLLRQTGFLLVWFWAALVFVLELNWPAPLAFVAAYVTNLVAFAIIYGGSWWLRAAATRRTPPVDCPAPPEFVDEGPVCRYTRQPKPIYPPAAQARGQCGWVALRLKLSRSGRVKAYAIIDQCPDRLFERAVVYSMRWARLAKGHRAEEWALITFVAPGPAAPDWAKARANSAALAQDT